MDKYLSVITNFGCHGQCPYCITKGADLDIPKSTVEGLYGLSKAIKDAGVNWVSVSGGGDPMYGYRHHLDWWEEFHHQLAEACQNGGKHFTQNIHLELHTSYVDLTLNQAMHFSRIVHHLRQPGDICRILRLFPGQKIRVVFVVTEDFTPEKIKHIVSEVKKNASIDELSFRQMVDGNFQPTHYCEDYLKAGHKKDWWYIEQNDYNLYYCEGKVTTKFEDFKNG